MPAAAVCLVTTPVDRAHGIARALVEARVAACVNVIPAVRSVYRWEGEVQDDEEALLVVKTTPERTSALDDLLREVHPYDTYELVVLDVAGGNAAYLDWIAGSVGRPA